MAKSLQNTDRGNAQSIMFPLRIICFYAVCSPKLLRVIETTNLNSTSYGTKGYYNKMVLGNGTKKGTVEETFTSKITISIKRTEVTRYMEDPIVAHK